MVLSTGIFVQSCSNDILDSFTDEDSASYIDAINSIKYQYLQIVLEFVFQLQEDAKDKYSIYITCCEDIVTTITAVQTLEGADNSKQLVRLKKGNRETTA